MPAIRKTPAQKREEGIKIALRIGLAKKGMKPSDVARKTGLSPTTVYKILSDPLGREFRSVIIMSDALGVNIFSDEIIS